MDTYLEWEIIKDLKFRPSVSIDYTNLHETQFYNPYQGNASSVGGRGYKYSNWNILWKNTNALTYSKKIADVHNIDILGAFEAVENNYNTIYAQGTGYPDFGKKNLLPELTNTSVKEDASSFSKRWALVSYLGRLNYNYDHKYFFTGTFRRDGSSRFGENNKYGNFWSLGLSWNMKKELFLENIDIIDNLRLRGSYGTSGNDQIGVWDYLGLYSGDFTYNGVPGYVNNQAANPDLSWEQTNSFNIGIEFCFVKKNKR